MNKSIQYLKLNKEEFNFPNSKTNLIGFVKLDLYIRFVKLMKKIMNMKRNDG